MGKNGLIKKDQNYSCCIRHLRLKLYILSGQLKPKQTDYVDLASYPQDKLSIICTPHLEMTL